MDNQKREQGCSTHPICLGCINKFIDDLLTKQRREIAERFRKITIESIAKHGTFKYYESTGIDQLIIDLEREDGKG